MFVYLFGVFVPLENLDLFGDVTFAGEGLQILTYIYSALMAIEQWGFLTRHNYCDTGLALKIVISEDLWHSHLLPSVWQWSCH